MPISDRNPSAQVLSVYGRLFLIDCGEGTQKMMRKKHISFMKIEAIFISHIHGDHIFGLFGLLNSMAMYGRSQTLKIFGPSALGGIINFYKSYFYDKGEYEIEFVKVDSKSLVQIYESNRVKVSAFPLKHKIETYGYRFDEIPTPRMIAENRSISSYAYCSDTMPFEELSEYVKNVDTLYHEATYMSSMKDAALKYYHSTTYDAANCAIKAGVKQLLVAHYSSRISSFEDYLSECKAIFNNCRAVNDGDVIDF